MNKEVQDQVSRELVGTILVSLILLVLCFLLLFSEERRHRTMLFFGYDTPVKDMQVPPVNANIHAQGEQRLLPPSNSNEVLTPPLLDLISEGKSLNLEKFSLFVQQRLGQNYSAVLLPDNQKILFETLTPYEQLILMRKISILKNGEVIGSVIRLEKKESSIGETIDFLRKLATEIKPDPKISLQNTLAFGKDAFLYNNLDKKDRFRIVILSRDGFVYGWDIPSSLQVEFTPVLKSL